MRRHRVKSSAIRSVGFDPATRTLEVEFPGGVYDYHGVPATVYRQLHRAPSVGRFINSRIKNAYPFTGPLGNPGSRRNAKSSRPRKS